MHSESLGHAPEFREHFAAQCECANWFMTRRATQAPDPLILSTFIARGKVRLRSKPRTAGTHRCTEARHRRLHALPKRASQVIWRSPPRGNMPGPRLAPHRQELGRWHYRYQQRGLRLQHSLHARSGLGLRPPAMPGHPRGVKQLHALGCLPAPARSSGPSAEAVPRWRPLEPIEQLCGCMEWRTAADVKRIGGCMAN